MAQELLVMTNYGQVQGRHRVSFEDVKHVSFQGIPYARPPVGELRFKTPQKPEPWTGVFDATAEGPYCPNQPTDSPMPPLPVPASEDCLRLNIFKNNADFTTKVQVMVYIHGGGFVFGSSLEFCNGQDGFMRKDVLLITINYRLGLLGFLSIEDPSYNIPGNAGLKDQTMALRWVIENCAHFGGDPENITIFGISAGGASVHYHLISEYSKGLFHKAIAQSGSVLNAWANRSTNSDLDERLARNIGWNGEGGKKAMYDLILSTDSDTLVKNHPKPSVLEKQNGLLFNYVPVVEPYDNGDCFVPRALDVMNREAWGNKIPLILGGTSDEGYLFFNEYSENKDLFADDAWFRNALPRELDLPLNSDKRKQLGEELKRHYFKDQTPSLDNVGLYANLLGEKLFWHGINAIAKSRLADRSAAPTFLYQFKYTSQLMSVFHYMMTGEWRPHLCIHGEDTFYTFKAFNQWSNLPEGDCVEKDVINHFITLWDSFAASGKPTEEDFEWEQLDPNVKPFRCLRIAPELEMIDLPNTKEIAFWDSLYNY